MLKIITAFVLFSTLSLNVLSAGVKPRIIDRCVLALQKKLNFKDTIHDFFGQFTNFDIKKIERILERLEKNPDNVNIKDIESVEDFIAYSYFLGNWKKLDDSNFIANLNEARRFKKIQLKKAASKVFRGIQQSSTSSKKNKKFADAIIETIYTKPYFLGSVKKNKVSDLLSKYVLSNTKFHQELLVRKTLHESIDEILRDVTKDLSVFERLEFKERVFRFASRTGKISLSLVGYLQESFLKKTAITIRNLEGRLSKDTLNLKSNAIKSILKKGYVNSGKEVELYLNALYKDLNIKDPLKRESIRRYIQGGVSAIYSATLVGIGYFTYKMFISSENIDDAEILDEEKELLLEIMVDLAKNDLSLEERKRIQKDSSYEIEWRRKTKDNFLKMNIDEMDEIFKSDQEKIELMSLIIKEQQDIKRELDEDTLGKTQRDVLINDLLLTRLLGVYEQTPIIERNGTMIEIEQKILNYLNQIDTDKIKEITVSSDEELNVLLNKIPDLYKEVPEPIIETKKAEK